MGSIAKEYKFLNYDFSDLTERQLNYRWKKEISTLDHKQQVLVEEFVRYNKFTQAARAAGYSENYAQKHSSRFFKRCGKAVALYRELLARKTGVSKEWVRQKLKEIVELGLDRSDPNLSAAVKGLAEICKINGYYAANKVQVQTEATVKLENLDIKLLAQINQMILLNQQGHGDLIATGKAGEIQQDDCPIIGNTEAVHRDSK